jgi:hypothetical protein
MFKWFRQLYIAAVAITFFTPPASAAIEVTALEVGSDVIFYSPGGSLSLNGLTKASDTTGTAFINPNVSEFAVGTNGAGVDLYTGSISYPPDFGTSGIAGPDSSSGQMIGFVFGDLIVRDQYVSGNPISPSTMTFVGESFASLNLTPGTYTWSWTGDSITLHVSTIPISSLTITAWESGGDVIFSTPGGTVNVGGLGSKSDTGGPAIIQPGASTVTVGCCSPNNQIIDLYPGIPVSGSPGPFGTGGLSVPTSGNGLLVGVAYGDVVVPDGYVPGDPLGAADMTFAGQTYASLGMNPGTYVWSWLGGSITLDVLAPTPQSSLVFTAVESGGDVVISTPGGTVNLDGLSKTLDVSGAPFVNPSSKAFASGIGPNADQYGGSITAPVVFGTGGVNLASSGDGPLVGIVSGEIIVPDNYASGDPLGPSSMIFAGSSFASLGMTIGSYEWSWPGGTITLNIADAVGISVEPTTQGKVHPHHDGGPGAIGGLNDVIPVVVYGSSVANGDLSDFDVSDIDTNTVQFGPSLGDDDPANPPEIGTTDYDNDGDLDAKFFFKTGDTGLQCSDSSAILIGESTSYGPFAGTDSIVTDCNAQCH